MNIEKLTIGQAREIAALFGDTRETGTAHPFAGQYVICRCYSAGVHAGVLISQSGDRAVLKDSRRLWSWKTKGGSALSGIAVHGLESGKVDSKTDIALTGVIETIPCSDAARQSIEEYR